MEEQNSYVLQIKQLSDGVHRYKFTLDDNFFANLDQNEVLGGDFDAIVTVTKSSKNISLDIDANGYAVVTCDRCLDEMEIDVDAHDTLTVCYGDSYSEEGDNIVTIDEIEGELDVSWLIYESIALALPSMHAHQEDECNQEMLNHISQLAPQEKQNNNTTDPRWDALKQLK